MSRVAGMPQAWERELPNDVEAERMVIACVMLDRSTYPGVRALVAPDDFYDELLRCVFGHIQTLAQLGKPLGDLKILADQLEASGQLAKRADLDSGDAKALGLVSYADLAAILGSKPTAAHSLYYARNVREKAIRRRLVLKLEEALDEAYSGPCDLGEGGRKTVAELMAEYPRLRPTVVDGLLREGETMNIISHTKVGKSWLAYNLAMSIAAGRPWLNRFDCAGHNVVLLDNELHNETVTHRVSRVAEEMAIGPDDLGEKFTVERMRGKGLNYHSLGGYFSQYEPGQIGVFVLDAHYRFLPPGVDENDNAAMAAIYNQIDAWADRLRSAFVLVHHTSKGNQSGKSVTDVGSGAGSQSRATDTHLVLRPHEQPEVFVLEAAVRSWKPVEPQCLRWQFPLWVPDGSLDPTALRQERPKRNAPVDDTAKDEAALKKILAKLVKVPAGQTRKWLRENGGVGAAMANRGIALGLELEQLEECEITKGGKTYDGVRIPQSAMDDAR